MLALLRALLRRFLLAALRWLDGQGAGPAASLGAGGGEAEWELLPEAAEGAGERADEEAAGAGRRAGSGALGGRAGRAPAHRPRAGAPGPAAEPRTALRPRRGAGGPVSQKGHAYAVWRLPGAAQDLRGVHAGGLRGWRAIAAAIPGGRYRPGTDRLQRAESLTAALAVYEAEAERHGAPTPTRVFAW